MALRFNLSPFPTPPPFQVGGSLGSTVPSYIVRQADRLLHQNLLRGEFCYVLNSRQMGKSSLMARTLQSLTTTDHLCTIIDISSLGTQNVTPSQWYRSIVAELWRGFRLFDRINYKVWWQDQGDRPPVQKLQRFLREVLLTHYPNQHLFIFLDEIDSVLRLEFCLDDFFALIRFCYNQRAVDPAYKQLTFAIFGVATPSDLIQDRLRTPFNVGQTIPLAGFALAECTPLIQGLSDVVHHPAAVVAAILHWTHGQPFLTQKLCSLIWHQGQREPNYIPIPQGTEAQWVAQLVRDRLLEHWDFQDEPEHLRTIRDRLLRNPQQQARLLGLYQQILAHDSVPTHNSIVETELLLSDLVIREAGKLRVKNPVYQAIFNQAWVTHQLNRLRLYPHAIEGQINSAQYDPS